MIINRIQAYSTPNKEPSGSSSRITFRHYRFEHGFKAASVSGCRGRCNNKPLELPLAYVCMLQVHHQITCSLIKPQRCASQGAPIMFAEEMSQDKSR
jgi:hypothetical protein